MNNNIYNISNTLQNILYEIEQNGGELTPELEEALDVTQQDFTNKVKQYSDVIKSIDADCSAIDVEIKRLRAYKESKKKLKERISKILIKAIEMFGQHAKSGGSYVDLGTEKVSVRNSTKIETNDEYIDKIASATVGALYSKAYFNSVEDVDTDSVIEDLKHNVSVNVNTGEEYERPIYALPSNFDEISADIHIQIPLYQLLEDKGQEMIKAITARTSTIITKGIVNKVALRTELTNNNVDKNNIAKIVPNKTLNIR